jgi:S-adenosylmethionine-diacylglycerol 3-amino-3-carboxypropyl transferase
MKKSFFEKINYSACNEDSESERKALKLTNEDIVLCITGSGARALDLLVDHPKSIISVDFNATQNYLLALKIAAYKEFTYPEFKSFVGLEAIFDRKDLYNKTRIVLSEEVKTYWDKNYNLIENGLLYCGTWELLQRCMIKAAFFRRKKIKRLLQSDNLITQQGYWKSHWDNYSWRIFLKIISNRFLWTKIIREPGALLIPKEFDVYHYISTRLNFLANKHLLKTNHFANLMFIGEYSKDCLLPIHLREENFETIKNQVDKIEIITDSLLNVVNQKQITDKITAYSLSDFSSYTDLKMYNHIWEGIIRNTKNTVKFCERHFLIKRESKAIFKAIKRDFDLEKELNDEDITAIYTFCVGTIN